MTDKEKLEKIIAEIDNLASHTVTANTPAFRAWKNETERFLIRRFGKDSYEYENFMDIKFSPTVYVMDTDLVKKCREGLKTSKLVFQSYLSEMDEEAVVPITPRNADSFNKVFIVHGHDGELKHAVARLVEKQGLEAIILSEQVNKGKTISEALTLSNQAVVKALGGLPAHKIHCSVLAEQSIKAAIADYYTRKGIDPTPIVGDISHCEHCHDGGCCNE